ncbi:Exopolygalacturonase [Sesamum alatum]|uniref:Exopolygalacturonase n=1 Tax=Sesamum alatum TaxID=300844 RepID=A0AAE1YVU3_9LAMI|nr:Exopolygalacturonase [Sesamum alatum]
MFLSIWSSTVVHCQNNIFKVTDSGAISSNQTSDSKQAFSSAWRQACQTNGGVLQIPQGNYFLSGAEFPGPCNGQTSVFLSGTVHASFDPVLPVDYWILFRNVDNLRIYGNGTLDGNGAVSWGKCQNPQNCKLRPISLKFNAVTNAQIQDIRSINSKFFHICIGDSQNIVVTNVHIWAPGNSTNTDGIHIGRSNGVRITNVGIATGDDCISIGDASSNINITGVSCGPGHGISIGSLGRYQTEKDVSLITVTNSTLSGTTNGLRIKTFASSTSLVVSGITYRNIIMNNVRNPIIIDQHYCPSSQCAGQGESNVLIKGVKYIGVRGSSSTSIGVKTDCSRNKPCQDIEFSGLNLTYQGKPTTASCSNSDDKFMESFEVPSHCS